MLAAPPPSSIDFEFSIGPVPVRVSWTHWMGSILLGWSTLYTLGPGGAQPIFLLLWMAVVFVSILGHELGHAFAARLFGYPSQVVLYFFGGLAYYPRPRNHTSGREIFIVLAGPGAGFLIGLATYIALVMFSSTISGVDHDLLRASLNFTLVQMIFVNVVWTVFNLLPVLPLDGGRVCEVICRTLSPNSGALIARWIGVVVAGLVAFLAFRFLQSIYVGFLFVMFAFWNYQDIQNNR